MEQIQVFSKNKRILPINLKEELLKHDIIEKKYGLLLRNEKKIHQFIDFCEGLINQAAFYLLLIYTNKIKYKIKYLRTQEDKIEFYKKQYDKFYNDLINNELIYRFDSKKEISKNFGRNGLILDYLDYCLLLYEKNKFSAKELEKYDLIREWEDIAGKRKILNYLDNKIKKRNFITELQVKEQSERNNEVKNLSNAEKIKEKLCFMEGKDIRNGQIILNETDYNRLLSYTVNYFESLEIMENIKPMQTETSSGNILYTYSSIFKELYPSSKYPESLITFLHKTFNQLAEKNFENKQYHNTNIYKKLGTKPQFYDDQQIKK